MKQREQPHENWRVEVTDGDDYLREDEYQTLEFLRDLQAALEMLARQRPPYTRLDPPESLQDKPTRPMSLVAPESLTLHNLRSAIRKLENLLSERHPSAELGEYGTVTHHLGRRRFYGGFLDKRRTVPLLRRSVPEVIRFLEKVPKFRDHVKRENHAHFGIHYHYLDAQKKRSDTVLCFQPPRPWPLFAEKHAEKSAHFPARPRGWCEDRRKAVYEVLSAEKGRFSRREFRHPSSGAALVWQENAAFLRKRRRDGLEMVLTDETVLPLD
jgi:hypothetical protein